jgi:hypothetical protein
MALPFANPISQAMPGFGSPSCYGAATQTPTATGLNSLVIAATTTTPSTGGTAFNLNGGPAPTSGYWHLRVVNATATATIAFTVTVSDGTNIWTVFTQPVTAAGSYFDYSDSFKTDCNITTVTFNVTGGGTITSLPIDVEVSLV